MKSAKLVSATAKTEEKRPAASSPVDVKLDVFSWLALSCIVGPYLTDFVPGFRQFSSLLRLVPAALALFFMLAPKRRQLLSRPSSTFSRRASGFIVIAIVVVCFSAVWNRSAFPTYVLVNAVWLFVLTFRYLHRDQWVNVLRLSVLVLLMASTAQILFGFRGAFAPWSESSAGYPLPVNSLLAIDGRQQGVFSHPNTLGGIAALGLVLLATKVTKRSAHLLVWPLFCLLTAGSRTSDVAAFLGVVAILLLKNEVGRRFWASGRRLLVISLCTYCLLWAIGLFDNPITSATATGRGAIWSVLLNVAQTHLWTGAGPDYASRMIASGDLPIWAVQAHNSLIDALLSGGIPLAVCFIGWTVMSFQAMARGNRILAPVMVTYTTISLTESIGTLGRVTAGFMVLLILISAER